MKRKVVSMLLCLLLLGLAGYGVWRGLKKPKPVDFGDLANYAEVSRDAMLVPGPAGEVADRVVYLDQGWEPRDSMEFYTRPQGSRLLPYPWLLALEQTGAPVPFREPTHLARFGFLAQKSNPFNPDGLPVGFVKDPRRSEENVDWFGFTCAACHTAELHYQGAAFRIDGAPGQGDLDALLTALTAALKGTLDDPARFERFAEKVLAADPTARNRAELRDQVEIVYRARHDYDVLNRPPHPYGFARLDAFGRIVNALLVSGVGSGDVSQAKVPNAPVSYPLLWDTPHHDYVQWNASARNRLAGSAELAGLGRNVGQVIGVFGELRVSEPRTATVFTGYKSSVRVPDLIRLESIVRKLQRLQRTQ